MRRPRAIALVALALVALGCSGREERRVVQALLEAESSGAPAPSATAAIPKLELEAAYRIQAGYIEARRGGDPIAGFKAGFTDPAMQLRFALDRPMSAAIFASGRLEGAPTIALADYQRLWVETEVGFEIGTPLSQPLADVAAARAAIRAVRPIIELANVRMRVDPLIPLDLVAANMLSDTYLVGLPVAAGDVMLDGLRVALSRDGGEIHRWEGDGAALWDVALWLINQVVGQGYGLEPGMLLFSGSLGAPQDGAVGRYEASFGALGTVRFEVRP